MGGISILIANYNNGKYFKDCYDSLIAQTCQDFEVLIVDDASTDDSVDIIKSIIGQDERFKLVCNDENRGCGYTKRRCVELSDKELCGFLDPDDVLEPDAIEQMIRRHKEYPNASLVYSDFSYCDEELNIVKRYKTSQLKQRDSYFFNMKAEISHFSTFKKSFYKKTEGIYSFLKRSVDQSLYLQLYDVGDVIYLPKNLYLHRVHQGGVSKNDNRDRAYACFWNVIFKIAEKRNVNVENLFVENLVKRKNINKGKSKYIKFLKRLLYRVRNIG